MKKKKEWSNNDYFLYVVPGSPERLRVVPTETGSLVAVWLPPSEDKGSILRYTLYYEYQNKVKAAVKESFF